MSHEANKDQITFFAKTNFRNKEVPFGIKADDRRRHMYVIGKTGMGKTTMMENMAIQDIRNGYGVCFIDPHGDSVAKILNFIPNNRINDVIYFNPADLDHPIAFNILEAVETKYKHLVASGLMGVFTKIWANLWSARMEYILNNTVLALLDSPGNTMLGITRMYVDKRYRKKIIDNIKDPMVRSFWVDEWANLNEKFRTEAVAPIQNKVGQFLSSAVIRNIVGQPKSTLDLRDIMDNNKILLMDLSKGKVGEDNSALLGAMIITKLQLAALSRVDIPEHERPDFYLYVDEFQNFATESFATILSEARKYHLNLIVGHQYIGQLSTDRSNTIIRDAVFGNVGSIITFRIGAADAEFLETEFAPTFAPIDLVNQQKYHIILKLMINGVSSDPFTARTMPVNDEFFTGNAEKVIKVSRERFANPVAQVEEKISRWMGAEFHEQSAILIGSDADQLGSGEDDDDNKNDTRALPQQSSPLPQPAELPVVEAKVNLPSSPTLIEEEDEEAEEQGITRNFTQNNAEPESDNNREEVKPTTPQDVVSSDEKPLREDNIVRNNVSIARAQDGGQERRKQPPPPSRPQMRPDQRQQERRPFQDRRSGRDRRRRPQERFSKPPQKPQNPIWDRVAEVEKEKIQKIERIFDESPEPRSQPSRQHPLQSSEPAISPSPAKQVIEPGQSIKFD